MTLNRLHTTILNTLLGLILASNAVGAATATSRSATPDDKVQNKTETSLETTNKKASAEHKIGIVAHRGYWNCEEGGYSHNSLAALRAAGENGFWGSEFDVNMTADGCLLVFHDSKINGKRICEYNADELADYRLPNGEKIPTLDEFLTVAAEYPNTMLVLELKKHPTSEMEKSAADKCIATLKKYGLYSPERVMFISFSEYACRYFAENSYGFIIQYLADNRSISQLAESGINGIDMHYKKLLGDEKLIKEARENNFSINVWTVNNESDFKDAINAGVDFITTDNPQRVRELLGDSELRRCSQCHHNQCSSHRTAQYSKIFKEGDILFTAAGDSPMSSAITASTISQSTSTIFSTSTASPAPHTSSISQSNANESSASTSSSAHSTSSISQTGLSTHSATISYDHCAIYHKSRKGEYVIEASPSHGVRMIPLKDFISEALSNEPAESPLKNNEKATASSTQGSQGCGCSKDEKDNAKTAGKTGKIAVMRVSAAGFDADKSVKAVLTHLGEEYDWKYLPKNGKSYCSELIQESYQDKDGKLIFEAVPMNFLDSEGNIPEFWQKVFSNDPQISTPANSRNKSRKLQYDEINIPQGVPGSNPNMLAANHKLIDVYRID